MQGISELLLDIPQVKVKVHPGEILLLRLSVHSQIAESWLFRPAIDDWVVDDGQIITMGSHIDPSFVQLSSGNKVNQTVTVFIPSLLQPGQFLKSWLRFPGLAEESIPIEAEILSPEQEKGKHQVVEVSLEVTLPFNLEKNSLSSALDPTTAGIFDLMSGLMDLEKIPSRWLVAELLVILCQRGDEYVQTEVGSQLLNQIKTTRFFQNGVSVFASAQIPNWIVNSLKSVNTILGGESLLCVWEQWLFSLVGSDVQKIRETSVSPMLAEVISSKFGEAPDRWFAGIILGLAQSSPQILTTLHAISPKGDRTTAATHTLITTLPNLDILPVRWLVVELLVLLSQRGDEYAQTEAGRQLLQQLKPTRFFKNGVLAFNCAQVPRWLAISHEAAEAYQTSASLQIKQGGLLDVGEQWLWSLVSTDLNMSQLKSDISVSSAATDAFVTSLGIDAERWFSCVALGLVLISPRIAEVLSSAIASAKVPSGSIATSAAVTTLVSPPPSEQTILDSVLQEKGSLHR
jgi:hypothetical protein